MSEQLTVINQDAIAGQAGRQLPVLRAVNVKTVGGLLLALLVLLMFFSRTIYHARLPAVTAVRPFVGRLFSQEVSRGVAAFAEVENIFAPLPGTVGEVLVSKGDFVEQGQELIRMSFDSAQAERRLRELQNSRGRIQADIQSLHLQIERVERQIANLLAETPDDDYISTLQLDTLEIDIRLALAEFRHARDAYNDLRDLYDRDEEPRRQARLARDRAGATLERLRLQRDDLERSMQRQIEQQYEQARQRELSSQTRLADLQADIAAFRLSLQSRSLDLAGVSLQEEPYRTALEDFEAYAVITAPVSGTLLSLGAVRGEQVRENQLLAEVGIAGEFIIECTISLDNNFVTPGDSAALTNMSHRLTGTVLSITPTAQGKTVRVGFSSESVAPGETFDVTFQQESDTTFTLVPNSAVRQDNNGFFLNQIRRRDGIMGREFYLARVDVLPGDSDSRHTAILGGITFFEPIAGISSRAVSPGDVILLENEGDFFEK